MKNIYFNIIIFTICVFLFLSNFWISYPGTIVGDTKATLILVKLNWHPVLWSFILEGLFKLFGRHVYFLLLLNLIPFYLGVYILVIAYYKRYKNLFALFFLFPLLIGNIFFTNFHLHSSSLSPSWIFLLYSLILYVILVPIERKILTFSFILIVFIISLLSRHNAFIQVMPISIYLCYIFIKNINFTFVKKIFIYFICIFFTISLAIMVPNLIKDTDENSPYIHPGYTTFLYHMAGACVPSNDYSCFDKTWYANNKNWEDLKKMYFTQHNANWTAADWRKEPIFKINTVQNLAYFWIYSIYHHPLNYIKFQYQNVLRMWFQKFNLQKGRLPLMSTENWSPEKICIDADCSHLLKIFPKQELQAQFTPQKESIFLFLKKVLPVIDPLYFILINLIIYILTYFFKIKNNIFIFTRLISLFGFLAAILFATFTPNFHYRYIHPVLISSIFSMLGFLTYIYDLNKEREKNEINHSNSML